MALALQEKRAKETLIKKKKKKSQVPKHEDECFRCGEGGEILMCDKKGCPKAYHLNCLNLTKPPYGKWECPWHHCDDCGKASIILCVECPNSFCKEHGTPDNVFNVDGQYYCSDHRDEKAEVKSITSDSPTKVLSDSESLILQETVTHF
ncbi:histone-lysine N-methyltransferase NSD3-like [Tachypleus tridentatus]